MILYRLLLKLFEYGTSFVMTSNYEPSTLYPDGLHRDRILPAIELIQKRMDILNVDAGVDYRRRSLEQVQCYHTPLDEQARAALQDAFDRQIGRAHAELQSLMRISYAVFCLKKKNTNRDEKRTRNTQIH